MAMECSTQTVAGLPYLNSWNLFSSHMSYWPFGNPPATSSAWEEVVPGVWRRLTTKNGINWHDTAVANVDIDAGGVYGTTTGPNVGWPEPHPWLSHTTTFSFGGGIWRMLPLDRFPWGSSALASGECNVSLSNIAYEKTTYTFHEDDPFDFETETTEAAVALSLVGIKYDAPDWRCYPLAQMGGATTFDGSDTSPQVQRMDASSLVTLYRENAHKYTAFGLVALPSGCTPDSFGDTFFDALLALQSATISDTRIQNGDGTYGAGIVTAYQLSYNTIGFSNVYAHLNPAQLTINSSKTYGLRPALV
jgi:hypothetical protein